MLASLFRGLLIAAVLFGSTVWLMDGAPSFKSCVQQKQENSAGKSPENNLSAFVLGAAVYRDCLLNFVKGNRDEVLALFTILLAIATIFLWFATRDLVRGSERTARSQLRAYVGIAAIDIKKVTPSDKPVATIIVKNFGQTPAYQVRFWVDSVVAVKGTTTLSLDAKSFSGEKTVNPSDTFSIVSRKSEPLSSEEAGSILDDVDRYFLIGEIRYLDAFGYRRKTHFRHETGGKDIIAMERLLASKIGNKST